MDFYIKRHGRAFAIFDASDTRRSEELSREAAAARKDALDAAERERHANDPEALKRRAESKAYKIIARDPVLKILKQILPREGEVDRTTRESYKRSLKFIGSHMSIASSDPSLHAELNRTPGQRRVSNAAKARLKKGKSTHDQVLALKRAKMSDAKIAKKLDIDVRTVRRHKNADKSSG